MAERGRVLAVVPALVFAIGIVACDVPTGSPSPPAGSPSGAIGVPATSEPLTGSPSASASSGAAIVDPALLAILPAQVAGIALVAADDVAAGMIADPALSTSASAVSVGVVATGTATSDDFASASVVRLRPGIYSESFFADWRGSYDAAACAPAGGVASHRQQVIGARTVDVTLCKGGARTLHVHLAGDVLVSITSVGAGLFGDLVMAGLRE